MSNTPNYDAKVKVILDGLVAGERTCALTGEKWIMTEEEIGWYRKFNVPLSTFSPLTRWMQLHHFATGYQWWWNKHAQTGKPILTYHHPASGIRVLPDAEWFEKDFSSVWLEWDSSRRFFLQIRELQLQVPMPATGSIEPPENSVALVSLGDQNSFFVLACQSKNSFFSTLLLNADEVSEAVSVTTASQSHNVTHSRRIHDCSYVRECLDCMDCHFAFDCRHCEHCFGVSNKRNKQYLWFNEQLTKEEWFRRKATVDLSCQSVVRDWFARFEELMQQEAVWPENFNEKSTDSLGEYLTESTRCRFCYNLEPGAVDNYWCAWGGISNGNAFSIGIFNGASNCFNSMNTGKSANCLHCVRVVGCDACEYCFGCYHCRNCFACVGLQRKEFHIFNKPYSEQEYWRRVDEIKSCMLDNDEYGHFFPASMSTAWHKLSGARVYCLADEEILRKLGGNDFAQCEQGACGEEPAGLEIKSIDDIPDCLADLGDSWTKTPVYDPIANRRFAFLKPELDHYRKFKIAPPNAYFVRRMIALHEQMQAAAFEDRACARCGKSLLTSKIAAYPHRKVYCMNDYLKFIEQQG